MTIRIPATAVLLFLVASSAAAQDTPTIQVEIGGGFGFPMRDWADNDVAEGGPGASGLVRYNVSPGAALYAGATWWRFTVKDDAPVLDHDGRFTDVGVSGGLEVFIAERGAVRPFIGGGFILDRLTTEADDNEFESEWSPGFEVRLGVQSRISDSAFATPVIRYRSFKPKYDEGIPAGGFSVSYLTVELSLGFGQ